MSSAADGYWLGTPGGLVRLPDRTDAYDTTPAGRVTHTTTLSGQRHAMIRRGRQLRSWQVNLDNVHPDEIAPLLELLAREIGPWWWVSPSARATNVLTPGACDLTPLIEVGARATTDGVAQRAWATGGKSVTTQAAPVLLREPVTGSVYVAGAAGAAVTVALQWITAAGTVASNTTVKVTPGPAPLARAVITAAEPPANATMARLKVTGATLVAQPAITWTTGPNEWGPGEGAQSVTADEPPQHVTFAVPDPAQPEYRRANYSVTVTELSDVKGVAA